MPRDGSGVYSLPVGYLAVTGSPILASQHNPPLEDIQDAISASLPRDGAAGMTGDLKMATGTKITWNSGDVTVTHSANTLAFAGASVGYTFDAPLSATGRITGSAGVTVGGSLTAATTGAFSGAVSMAALTATSGTLSGSLSVAGGIVGALDEPIYLYFASASNQAYWVADTATGNVRLVTGTSSPTTKITVAADTGAVSLVSGLTISGAFAGGTTGNFSGGITAGSFQGVLINTAAGALATSIATLTNFSGASTGTLTNAPVVGNPTKWIAINDNGTVRYIPTWS